MEKLRIQTILLLKKGTGEVKLPLQDILNNEDLLREYAFSLKNSSLHSDLDGCVVLTIGDKSFEIEDGLDSFFIRIIEAIKSLREGQIYDYDFFTYPGKLVFSVSNETVKIEKVLNGMTTDFAVSKQEFITGIITETQNYLRFIKGINKVETGYLQDSVDKLSLAIEDIES